MVRNRQYMVRDADRVSAEFATSVIAADVSGATGALSHFKPHRSGYTCSREQGLSNLPCKFLSIPRGFQRGDPPGFVFA